MEMFVLAEQTFLTIAKQLEMPTQIGNCLRAVNLEDCENAYFDRREDNINWTNAFGLSLQGNR